MDIKQLLEKMDQFAGQAVGQKPGDQWRGTDAAPPGKKLVGDSILKDLSKGKKAKSKEQELSEEFQAFLEAEFKDTVDKRPARKNARHSRGHEPLPRYKTVKADEAVGKGIDYHDQIPIKSVMQGLNVDYNRKTNQTVLSYKGQPIETFIYDGIPTLGYFNVAVDHKVAELMKLGKIPKMPSLPRDRSSQPQTYNLDQEYSHGIDLPKNVQQQMFQQHDQDTENYGMVSVSNPAKWANVKAKKEKEKEKQQKVAESMSDKDIELQDYRSMSHKEFQTAYKMTKTEWINKNKSLVIQNPSIKKALGLDEGAEQDPIVAKVVKQMRPGLAGLNMGNEAFLYFAYELGKQRARDAWEDYLPAIRAEYEKGLNEDANTDNKLAKLLTRFINQNEGADRAVASDAIEYIRKLGHIEQFATSLDYFAVDLDEGLEEDESVEARWMVKVSDDEGDHLKTYHRKFPSLSAAKKAYENTPYASDFKYKPVKKDQVEEAVDSDIVQPMGQDLSNRAGYNPISDESDYLKKLSDLSNLSRKPGLDQQMKDQIKQRILDLNAEARKKGYIQAESRGHNIISTKLKNLEREKKFASGELKIPTPQERQAQLKRLEKAKPVKEYGANNPPQNTANQTMQQKTQAQDPKQAQAVAQATQTLKAATGSTAPNTTIAKAIDTASQGKPVGQQDMKVLEPVMKDVATIAQDPKLAGQFKTLAQQANQAQLKQKQQQK